MSKSPRTDSFENKKKKKKKKWHDRGYEKSGRRVVVAVPKLINRQLHFGCGSNELSSHHSCLIYPWCGTVERARGKKN